MRRAFLFLLGLAMAVSGCAAGWHRIDDLRPRALPARTQVQVWQGKRNTLLHGVSLDGETIRGVPFTRPADCDSCRVTVPLGTVDSLRTGSLETGFARSAGAALLVMAVGLYLTRGLVGN